MGWVCPWCTFVLGVGSSWGGFVSGVGLSWGGFVRCTFVRCMFVRCMFVGVYLGNTVTPFLTGMDSVIDEKISDMEEICKKWLYRFQSPLGRAVVAKTILYPKVIHIFSVIPMTQSTIKKVEAVLFRFVWGGEKKDMFFVVKIHNAGLKMVEWNS